MKWSTLVAICAGGLAVVAAVVAVQLWSLDTEPPAIEEQTASSAPDEPATGSGAELDTSAGSASIESASTSGSNREDQTETVAAEEPSGSDESNLPSADPAAQAGLSGQSDSVVTRVSGDVGNLTFERRSRDNTSLPTIDATSVSVVGEDGRTFEFSSSTGQPVVVTQSLDDGLYKWEAVHQPDLDPRVRQEMTAVRESGDIEAERRLMRKFRKQGLLPTEEEVKGNVQSGSFRVAGGQLVDSTRSEGKSD